MDTLSEARIMLKSGSGNLVAACETIAPFAFAHPFQSSCNALSLGLPPPCRRKGHGLNLHGIDTG